MLLELLNHHEDLFMAAVGPLIDARKAADLARLAACCRQMRLFIYTISFYKHSRLLCQSLKIVKDMNILDNERCSIKEYDNDLHIFRYLPVSVDTRYIHILDNNYYIRTIKARKFYHIECSIRRIWITESNDYGRFSIYIVGPVPLWISKYSINTMNKKPPCYTFDTRQKFE